MSWIETVPYKSATGKLKVLYDRIKGHDDNVDNIMMAHSLRPHSGRPYGVKNVLHHARNEIGKWFLETLGVYVSHLNGCAYCVDHHFAGLARLLADDVRAAIKTALTSDSIETDVFTPAEQAALGYAAQLTRAPQDMREDHVADMREAGWSDGEILEINQVVAYFAYATARCWGWGAQRRAISSGCRQQCRRHGRLVAHLKPCRMAGSQFDMTQRKLTTGC